MIYQYLLRFTGPVAFVAKVITLLIVNSVLILLTNHAFAADQLAISVFLLVVLILVNYIYFSPKYQQFKFSETHNREVGVTRISWVKNNDD